MKKRNFGIHPLLRLPMKLYFRVVMTFYEKYPQLQEKAFLIQVLTETVFSTMSLEDQQVPKNKVEAIVQALLAEEALKSRQLPGNQAA